MFRWLRWQKAKKRLASLQSQPPLDYVRVSHHGHQAQLKDFSPDTAAYQRLSHLWDGYATGFFSGYAEFLAAAADYYGQTIKSVLDVGCGTGTLARQLAAQGKL